MTGRMRERARTSRPEVAAVFGPFVGCGLLSRLPAGDALAVESPFTRKCSEDDVTAATPIPPSLIHAVHVEVQVGAPIEIGPTPAGLRRVIPITGGVVSGPMMSGRVLPGGADFQVIRTETETVAEARYVLETDGGELVYVENTGLRTGSAEDIARLRRDQPVDPALIYFRSAPRFETAAPRLASLTSHVFVGSGVRQPRAVIFDFFQVR